MAASLVICAFRPQVACFACAGLRLVDGEPPGLPGLVLRAREHYLPGRAAVEVFFGGVVGELLPALSRVGPFRHCSGAPRPGC
jgi:hypothetical protein